MSEGDVQMCIRSKTAARAALAALIGALAAPAAAQQAVPAAPDAQLEGLVAEALANNPDVLATAEAVAAAQQRPAQAGALPDPSVSVQYTNDGWSPTLGTMAMTTLAFMGSQSLPWPGKRDLRAAVAATDAAAARQQVERARLTLAAEVKRAFWGLALARETLALAAEQREVWRDAEAVARGRYGVGLGSQQDVLRAQVEITRYEQQRVEQEAAVALRAAELNRLLNRAADAPPPQTPALALRARPAELAGLWAEAEARSPELRAATVAGERERLSAELARKDFRPDLIVQAAYMNRGGLDPMWQAGVAINLPVYRGRRRAAVAEAEALGREAQRRLESVRAQLRYRTQERLAQLAAAEALYRLSSEALVPQARLAYEASIASYQAGRVPFLAVLEALSSLYGDRLGQLRIVAAHERIKAALDEASLDATSELPAASVVAMGSRPDGPAPAASTGGAAAPLAAAAGMGSMGQ
jgi:outer membrane protein, heavy metal efflux system